jgi:hypothetical protein
MNSRKKQLIEQYKQMKPDMGIFCIRSKVTNKCLLETSQHVHAKINSVKFQLNAGMHPNRELQREWSRFGEQQFEIEVLELLKYDEDETKTDYTEELSILKFIWEQKWSEEMREFYAGK